LTARRFANRTGRKQNGKCIEIEEDFLTTVVVPKSGGVTSTKAIVSRWLKKEGDRVKQGDPLVELETEKISYELESPYEGVLLRILAKEAMEVPVGDPLCEIGESNKARRKP
jgi:pyruvate/2-oxoglutarate dehydrogenase complex dihydrolipoamide acyltransferase (E2) component